MSSGQARRLAALEQTQGGRGQDAERVWLETLSDEDLEDLICANLVAASDSPEAALLAVRQTLTRPDLTAADLTAMAVRGAVVDQRRPR